MNAPVKKQFLLVFFSFLFITSVIFVGGCAKITYPPGGPEDTTPPDIFSITPESGTVHVPLDTDIRIVFSEAIKRETAPTAIFISPQIDPEPNIKIKGDVIIISPQGNLKPGRTYVVTIGTDLRDAHGVKLNQSISLAFSTGEVIDAGQITGTVYRNGKGASGLTLALFESDPNALNRPMDSLSPAYVTQSGENGLYAFNYLPSRHYYLAAFEDKNKDRRISPVREMIGIPFLVTTLDSLTTKLSGVDMQMFTFDTTVVSLRSVSVNPDRLLKVRFSQSLESAKSRDLFASARLVPAIDTTAAIPIEEYIPSSANPASDYVCLTAPLETGQDFILSFDRRVLYPNIDDSVRYLTYTFGVTSGEDELPPSLLSSKPASGDANIDPDSAFVFTFSEPVRTTDIDRLIMLVDSAGDTTHVPVTEQNPFMLTGRPVNDLQHGRLYHLLLAVPSIFDRAGNRMGDSILDMSFSIIGADTAGSISGEIVYAVSSAVNSPIVLNFNPSKNGVPSRLVLPAGQTSFTTELLPGYYTITAFIDLNSNGEYDFGALTPYELSEPFTVSPDTVRVRTRFESTGAVITF